MNRRNCQFADAIRAVAESLTIPVIANGGSTTMENYDDIMKFKESCGVSSVMVARAALENVSIFRTDGPLSLEELTPEYLKMCVDFDNSLGNTKYVIEKMFKTVKKIRKTNRGTKFEEAESLQDLW